MQVKLCSLSYDDLHLMGRMLSRFEHFFSQSTSNRSMKESQATKYIMSISHIDCEMQHLDAKLLLLQCAKVQ